MNNKKKKMLLFIFKITPFTTKGKILANFKNKISSAS